MNILITRQASQSTDMKVLLEKAGFGAFVVPMIKTRKVDSSLSGEYDYLILTSPNSVYYFMPYMKNVSAEKCAAVGEVTAKMMEEVGLKVDIVPEKYTGDGLKKVFADLDISGKKIIIPGPKKRAGDLVTYLRDLGADVDAPTIFETVTAEYEEGEVDRYMEEKGIEVVTFASPSAASGFLSQVKNADKYKYVCIGKTTHEFLTENGVASVYPEKHTCEAMVELISEMYG